MCIMKYSRRNSHTMLPVLLRSNTASVSSALVESRSTVSLFASPRVPVVLLLLVPETRCHVLTLGNKTPLGTAATLRVILTSNAATLVVLEGKLVWLGAALGV